MGTISIEKICVSKNVRTIDGQELSEDFDKLPDDFKDGIKELAASIREQGLISPIVIANDKSKNGYDFRLVAGYRRLMAHKLLGRAKIDASVTKANKDKESIIQMIENVQREDLEPIAIANGLKAIKDETKCKNKDLAKMLGKSDAWVSNNLGLLKMAPEVQEAVKDRELNLAGARALKPLSKEDQVKTLKAARNDAEKEAKKEKKTGKKSNTKKSKSDKPVIKDKGARRQARETKKKGKGEKIRPLNDRLEEQKKELMDDFVTIEFGQDKPSKPQLDAIEKFWDYLHEKKRLVIK